ncbi:MAG: archease [candidate division WOR-3 bacterium]
MSYKYLNHTADLGIEVKGETLEELFINTAKAIFETQIRGTILIKKKLNFEIKSSSLEELLIEWCRELIYNFSVNGFIPKTYDVKITKGYNLKADLCGDVFDKNRHKIKLEIKNATYHNLNIKNLKKGYRATIIFDV